MDDKEKPKESEELVDWDAQYRYWIEVRCPQLEMEDLFDENPDFLVYLAELQDELDCECFVKKLAYIEKHHGPDFFGSLSDADQNLLLRELDGFWGKSFPEDGSWLLDLLK